MQTLTELIVRVTDLVEAEGRLLRANALRLAMGIGILAVALLLAGAGVLLLLGAVYILTAGSLGNAAGAAISGALALVIGGVLAWQGRRIAQ